jgi:Uma2 family endonuclease
MQLTQPQAVIVQPQPQRHRWTKDEYRRMYEIGWFLDVKVELIDGEVWEMPAPGHLHCASTDRTTEALRTIFPPPGHWIRMQMALDFGLRSEPQPDVAVVLGPRDHYADHPTTALLVVEVGDSTLQNDRTVKASLYARNGIEEYWIINIVDRRVEVYRSPRPDPAAPLGHTYGQVAVLLPGDHVSPLAAPGARIAVDDLLP